jgi:hypothetical protein
VLGGQRRKSTRNYHDKSNYLNPAIANFHKRGPSFSNCSDFGNTKNIENLISVQDVDSCSVISKKSLKGYMSGARHALNKKLEIASHKVIKVSRSPLNN